MNHHLPSLSITVLYLKIPWKNHQHHFTTRKLHSRQEAGRQEGPRRIGAAGGGRALRPGLHGIGQPAGGPEGVAGGRSAVPNK